MPAKPGHLPISGRWAFEPKLDGFRAIVNTYRELKVRSRPWDDPAERWQAPFGVRDEENEEALEAFAFRPTCAEREFSD
jgi:ATP-dependent DNA ligase